ncbi:hypothetical protein SAY86_003922 [Trapa natans]|uniref:Uncharacterized protein n=1 Tax=Trapa natans TaxID=22666 RepID=A0AAN7MDL0_TRANT|nr:hypothetical protein SAY86_003922 [Trapa natans]
MDASEGEVERLISTAKVVEYLEPVMSRDLLCKFPDSTAFGFDYSQSSIWSPLIPRVHVPLDSAGIITPKKLSDGSGAVSKLRGARKKIASSAVRISLRVLQRSRMKTKRNMAPKFRGLDGSPTPAKDCGCFPLVAEGWNKVLKAASKHIKKNKKKKKKKGRDPMAHVRLNKYLENGNIRI